MNNEVAYSFVKFLDWIATTTIKQSYHSQEADKHRELLGELRLCLQQSEDSKLYFFSFGVITGLLLPLTVDLVRGIKKGIEALISFSLKKVKRRPVTVLTRGSERKRA